MSTIGDRDDDEYSVIGDKGEIGFIDYDDDRSVCSYNPNEEGPVIISVPFPFVAQKPRSVFVDEVAADSITIKNTTDDAVELWKVHIYASNPDESFTLSLMKPSEDGFVGSSSLEDRILQPRRTLTVWLSCKPKEIGLHTSIVQFDVDEDRIERVVFLLAEDKISKGLASNKPYQRGRKKGEFVIGSYVTGVRPSRPKHRNFKYKLPLYEIPKEARELLENKQVPEAVMHGLSRNNYVSYFKTLIMMEEIGLEEEMRAYDMECVSMKNKGRQYLILEVPGLAERRPSLVHGDSVFAKLATDDTDGTPAYEGCIHRVEADEVHLKFADVFHQRHIDKNLYNVRFRYNRINMRRMYQAIEAAEELDMQILFPSESPVKRHIKRSTVAPITHALNKEQLNAVEMVLGCKGGLPFVIYGPPGTGKTMTLVEIILQIYKSQRDARILVCASSNCAADHILEKILDLEAVQVRENEVFRLNAASRPYEDIKPDYIRFCFFEDCVFKCPPLQALLQYRIIITTYMSASSLYTEGIKRGHFSHIILDEAGQASEPETMIPISKLYDKGTVVALAGDPMQLGPVIYSKEAENFGLGSSYLQRLFDFELYYNRDESHVMKLIRNYRCHPEILCLPSNLFYEGDLIPCQEVSNSSLSWSDLLPNKEFPVLFIGIQGCDEREGNNPSWFNRIEVSKVVEIIKKLVARNVNEVDIGVITPYRQQVNKIRMVLEMLEMSEVKIGSVEQFQGQERDVIIVSTVRSTVKHNEFDRKHCLGFLSNPRRFNVAITRARSLLVIVGNPHIICKDPYWEQLLWRCVEYNSYQGCALPEKQSFPNEDPPNEENGFEGAEEQENKEWSEEAAVCDQEDPWTDDIPKPVKDEDEWSDGWK